MLVRKANSLNGNRNPCLMLCSEVRHFFYDYDKLKNFLNRLFFFELPKYFTFNEFTVPGLV